MKRSCDGCRAVSGYGVSSYCAIRCKSSHKRNGLGAFYLVPDADCPKPKTYREYFDCQKSQPLRDAKEHKA